MSFNDDSTFCKRDTVIERRGEELLLFDASSGKLFELNETGKTIWNMINGKHNIKDIKEKIKKDYTNSHEIEKDLSEFLNRLYELNLLEEVK